MMQYRLQKQERQMYCYVTRQAFAQQEKSDGRVKKDQIGSLTGNFRKHIVKHLLYWTEQPDRMRSHRQENLKKQQILQELF